MMAQSIFHREEDLEIIFLTVRKLGTHKHIVFY